MLCSLTEGDTEIPCCVSKKIQNLSILLTHLQRSPSPCPLACTPAPPNWSCSSPLGVKDSFRSQRFQPGERRAEHATARALLQEAGQNSPAAPHHLTSSSSLFSLCPRLLPWPGEDQDAHGHYLLQAFLIVFCHPLDAMGRVRNFGAPSLESEGTDLTGWGRRFGHHHKHWSAQQMLLRGVTVVAACTASSSPACVSTRSLPGHLQPAAGETFLGGVDLQGKGTEYNCGSSVVRHKGKPSVCTQQGKLCNGYNC